MAVLIRVAPWIFYGIGAAVLGKAWASPLAALASAVLIGRQLAMHAKPSELILDVSTLVYFVGFSVLVLSSPHSPAVHYVAAGAQLFQGAVVGAFLLARLPFTLPIAQRGVSPALAKSGSFYKFNVRLTAMWLAAFLLSGILLVALTVSGDHSTSLQVGIVVVAIVAPYLAQKRMIDELARPAP